MADEETPLPSSPAKRRRLPTGLSKFKDVIFREMKRAPDGLDEHRLAAVIAAAILAQYSIPRQLQQAWMAEGLTAHIAEYLAKLARPDEDEDLHAER